MFNTTFNSISVITLQSVLLLKETGVPGEMHVLSCGSMSLLNKKKNVLNIRLILNKLQLLKIEVIYLDITIIMLFSCLFHCTFLINNKFLKVEIWNQHKHCLYDKHPLT